MSEVKNNPKLVEYLKGIGVLQNPKVFSAFKSIDRADFVKPVDKKFAYENFPLSIGYGQTISQPFTVAFMLEKLEPKKGDEILDIGSGSGWTTALLAQIVGPTGIVIGLELNPELAEFGRRNLQKYKLNHARIEKTEKKVLGKPSQEFDKILVSASARKIPKELIEQLKPNGILVVPVEHSIFKVTKKIGAGC
ncbi:MAG: Protein-L-isoaspartate(D-aspartate) O-methyltransferase [candidate division WWE3 bacterium GW2011_GWA1_46_21]|uniref:Protein-L-isoaspartate O-methyltransferase n=2 Tax=Katanobacteria TaxID=422282 RepID=A0A0G1PFF0_UNCKA|nr:MAG: Protein-L-isoaspartate(D-aspartate) O-methyltransferase [candidate division WWE3 bacterium GW2011_GWA1_46_21]KKU57846.1 MAG: Protein-L-isoaspartate(D-aspartate) O-methyltransferase [candidate division WWE3 bacterium GW2011_GWB1_47_11]